MVPGLPAASRGPRPGAPPCRSDFFSEGGRRPPPAQFPASGNGVGNRPPRRAASGGECVISGDYAVRAFLRRSRATPACTNGAGESVEFLTPPCCTHSLGAFRADVKGGAAHSDFATSGAAPPPSPFPGEGRSAAPPLEDESSLPKRPPLQKPPPFCTERALPALCAPFPPSPPIQTPNPPLRALWSPSTAAPSLKSATPSPTGACAPIR